MSQDYFAILLELEIFTNLSDYSPRLVGTFPIGISVPGSDLDIICEVRDFSFFLNQVISVYSRCDDFQHREIVINDIPSLVINFSYRDWKIEIFAQDIPVESQNGFLHMEIERRLLAIFGEEFRAKIIELKKKAWKTEPAFAHLLALPGNSYFELLKISSLTDQEIYQQFSGKIQAQRKNE